MAQHYTFCGRGTMFNNSRPLFSYDLIKLVHFILLDCREQRRISADSLVFIGLCFQYKALSYKFGLSLNHEIFFQEKPFWIDIHFALWKLIIL
jgi:hypothetical protein